MKRILIPILIILFLVSLGFLYSYQKNISTTQRFGQTDIPRLYNRKFEIAITISKDEFNFPQSIPQVQLVQSGSYSQEDIQPIINSLGFNDEPIVSKDTRFGETLIYKNGTAGLVIYKENKSISYSLIEETPQNSIGINENMDYQKIAKDFLSNNFNIPNERLGFASIRYLARSGTENLVSTSKERANIVQVSFSQNINGTKIISINPENLLYTIFLRTDGTVQTANISDYGEIRKLNSSYDLKNYEEVSSSLDQASIISLDEGNVLIEVIDEDIIEKISINKIELGYLLINEAKNQKSLQPVYILEGTAKVTYQSQNVKVVLYLLAEKN